MEVEGSGVMKDEDLKFEEIEVSDTLGGVERCYDVVIHTQNRQVFLFIINRYRET